MYIGAHVHCESVRSEDNLKESLLSFMSIPGFELMPSALAASTLTLWATLQGSYRSILQGDT